MTDTLAVVTDARLRSLWAGVRVVVLDAETLTPPGGGKQRVVAVAAVTCRGGVASGSWYSLVNPGIPIDARSHEIHRLTDEQLVGVGGFADVADSIVKLLTPVGDELVVLTAHNVSFDVSVLRHEFRLLGQDLPDVAILDTMGKFPTRFGVRPPDKSQTALLDTLGLINHNPHNALGDATACATALIHLVRLASAEFDDFADLLAEVAGRTVSNVAVGARSPTSHARPSVTIPADHLAGHTEVLAVRAGRKMFNTWRTAVAECATLRCPHLLDRVRAAEPPRRKLVGELEIVLAERAGLGDIPGAATVLAAVCELAEHVPAITGHNGQRRAHLAFAKRLTAVVGKLGRCTGDDLCPACADNAPCPLDTWPETLAAHTLGEPASTAQGFFKPTGKHAGSGVWNTWQADGIDRRLADAALWLCVEHWRHIGQEARAAQVVELAWNAGCRQPRIAASYARQVGASNRRADLETAIIICDAALTQQAGSTCEHWEQLIVQRNLLAGRAHRAKGIPTGAFDDAGNPVLKRRHNPDRPRRLHPTRLGLPRLWLTSHL